MLSLWQKKGHSAVIQLLETENCNPRRPGNISTYTRVPSMVKPLNTCRVKVFYFGYCIESTMVFFVLSYEQIRKKNICQIWVKGLNSSPVSVTKVLHELYHMRNVAELTVMVEDNDNRVLRKVPDSQLVESGLLAML